MSSKKKSKKNNKDYTVCPGCGKEVETHKCRFCGATKSINQVSGNVIWMRSGRVISAFKDERDAFIQMARRYGIEEGLWPKVFRGE